MEIDIHTDVPLADHTTFKVGGLAAQFVAVHSEAALAAVWGELAKEQQTAVILGGGSNVLIAEHGIADTVVKICLKGIAVTEEKDRVLVQAEAGENFDDLVAYAVALGYWGLENLSHIPGSVGATPVQNVGAYGVEVADLIHSVRVYDCKKETYRTLTPRQCRFGYRDSVFKQPAGKHFIVTQVTFVLSTRPQPQLEYRDLAEYFVDTPDPALEDIRAAVIAIRAAKFPDWHQVGTAGSFFKNPTITAAKFADLRQRYPELPGYPQNDGTVKVALGWILDKVLHLKGSGTDKVGCYQGQALVLINRGEATATDIKKFADDIAKKVYTATGISIEWEVTPLGF